MSNQMVLLYDSMERAEQRAAEMSSQSWISFLADGTERFKCACDQGSAEQILANTVLEGSQDANPDQS